MEVERTDQGNPVLCLFISGSLLPPKTVKTSPGSFHLPSLHPPRPRQWGKAIPLPISEVPLKPDLSPALLMPVQGSGTHRFPPLMPFIS